MTHLEQQNFYAVRTGLRREGLIINAWNSLPECVISASTTDSFKYKPDKFWSNQDIIFDYKAGQIFRIGTARYAESL